MLGQTGNSWEKKSLKTSECRLIPKVTDINLENFHGPIQIHNENFINTDALYKVENKKNLQLTGSKLV